MELAPECGVGSFAGDAATATIWGRIFLKHPPFAGGAIDALVRTPVYAFANHEQLQVSDYPTHVAGDLEHAPDD
jgi:hypothetical protein